jgi:hypothetical protein
MQNNAILRKSTQTYENSRKCQQIPANSRKFLQDRGIAVSAAQAIV